METKTPLISVIVPFYNTGSLINKCLESLLNQNYKNFEIILINDGSTDNTIQMIKPFLSNDKLVYIEKNNGGLSSARNCGLCNAKGQYVTFVDSDDFVSPDYLRELYSNLSNTSSDISICSVTTESKWTSNDKAIILSKEQAMLHVANNKMFQNYFPTKLFKIELFKDMQFPENQYFEDISLLYKIVNISNRVVYTSSKLYFYRQNRGSISKKITFKKAFDYYFSVIEKYLFYVKHYPAFASQIIPEIINSLYLLSKKALKRCSIDVFLPKNDIHQIFKTLKLRFKVKYLSSLILIKFKRIQFKLI